MAGAGRRVVQVTLDNLDDLPVACRRCVFWELDPVTRGRAVENGDGPEEKEAWVSRTLLEWGSCGRVAYVDGVVAGYVLYAPPALVPGSTGFPTSPVSPDAVLLMATHVVPEFRGQGLGRVLVQTVAKDLIKRGVRAVEAFGVQEGGEERGVCVAPADHFLAVGFKTVRPHHRYPRLRMELKSAVSWKEDVEVALERLLSSMSPGELLRPRTQVGTGPVGR